MKTAIELEDYDFLKMVDELKIDYDENDLREIEKEVNSQLARLQMREEMRNEMREISKI